MRHSHQQMVDLASFFRSGQSSVLINFNTGIKNNKQTNKQKQFLSLLVTKAYPLNQCFLSNLANPVYM